MKFRKNVLVLGIIAGAFLIAANVVSYFAGKQYAGGMGLIFKSLAHYLSNFSNPSYIAVNIVSYAGIGLGGLLGLIWLIVDLCKKKWIGILFFFMMAETGLLISAFTTLPLYFVIGGYVDALIHTPIILTSTGLIIVTFILMVVLFIVDMATKRKSKELEGSNSKKDPYQLDGLDEVEEDATPVEEVVEEVTPVEEIKEEEEVAPAPVEEEVAPVPVAVMPVAESNDEKEFTVEPEEVKEKKKPTKPRKKPAKKANSSDEGKSTQVKAYHVSRRPELNKWQVKLAGGEKALKLFDTQKEAIEYADELAKSTGAAVRVHSKAGKMRKA